METLKELTVDLGLVQSASQANQSSDIPVMAQLAQLHVIAANSCALPNISNDLYGESDKIVYRTKNGIYFYNIVHITHQCL